MRLYIIGPVTGKPGNNLDAFRAAQKAMEALGHVADIPHSYVEVTEGWPQAMRRSVNRMTASDGDAPLYDGVVCLPGWRRSRGAMLEYEVARACGIPAKDLEDCLDPAAAGAAQDAAMPCLNVGQIDVKVEIGAEELAKGLRKVAKPMLRMAVE